MQPVVARFLGAVGARDIDAVLDCFTDDLSYQNVPHEPVRGKDGLRALLGPFLHDCERARWDVVSSATNGELDFVERVDRFWFAGQEYAIECTGIYRIAAGRIAEVRDYVDLGVWRERLAPVRVR